MKATTTSDLQKREKWKAKVILRIGGGIGRGAEFDAPSNREGDVL